MKDLIEGLRAVGLTVLTEEDLFPKEVDQTWRDDLTKRQHEGERFDYLTPEGKWSEGFWNFYTDAYDKPENFRKHVPEPKTETWYMVMGRFPSGEMMSYVTQDKAQIFADAVTWPYEIIGDVVEREVRCG